MPLLNEALRTDPQPLPPMETYVPSCDAASWSGCPMPLPSPSPSPSPRYMLSWDAASERLLDAAALPQGTKATRDAPASKLAYRLHYGMGVQPVFDMFRSVTGAPPVTPWRARLTRLSRSAKQVCVVRSRRARSAATYPNPQSDPCPQPGPHLYPDQIRVMGGRRARRAARAATEAQQTDGTDHHSSDFP